MNFDGNDFHVDLRVSIPKEQMSLELITDLLSQKNSIVNGYFINRNFIETKVRVLDFEGKDVLSFEKTAKEL